MCQDSCRFMCGIPFESGLNHEELSQVVHGQQARKQVSMHHRNRVAVTALNSRSRGIEHVCGINSQKIPLHDLTDEALLAVPGKGQQQVGSR